MIEFLPPAYLRIGTVRRRPENPPRLIWKFPDSIRMVVGIAFGTISVNQAAVRGGGVSQHVQIQQLER